MAFFPCIYFNEMSQSAFYLTHNNYRKMTTEAKISRILDREKSRSGFYRLLIKMCGVCLTRGVRLIVENPWTAPQYLNLNFLKQPTIVDHNRMLRGDYYRKPTAYWFFGCEPTRGETIQKDKEQKIILRAKAAPKAGLCSEDRSMISPDYARNFICDFILGKPSGESGKPQQQDMFDLVS